MAYNNERGCVVTIGTFDGVHVGHQAIIKRLVKLAKQEQLDAVLLTFFPHPRMVLQRDTDLKLINTLAEKKEVLESLGIDHMVVEPFTKEFSRLTALEYVRDILVNQLNAKHIIIGYDHRFGRNRTANIDNLKEYGETYDFNVEEITAQELNDVAISSTKIRNALNDGDISTANNYLGYRYTLSGNVTQGKGIGKDLGFPTANLKVDQDYKLIPKKGVYLVQANLNGSHIYGLTSIGTNPTVGGTHTTIETFLMDFEGNLYDQPLTLEFITHIREEKHFESVEHLIEAIKADEAYARQYLKQHE
ncbi:bifunctional riboflavin kinase/FAD synthetase [Aureisphaera galaxeae]|uniref:bifunctional riboflavin kinase/FAD synthetase n=1 Tax=Aureisphaera galaxeae TaxID=1538023 RepID=UPI002350DB20|nr:bifunctional riboflavin kinase/FAD synthetase [Aureisphaera galaxeae]MDC8005969.1 bifunctional riboflavin kinase/FAD synthetase [Aureisphaera galaxeae]